MCRCEEYRYTCRCEKTKKKYGFFGFMGDLLMTAITSGLWLIWIFVREMRNR